MTDQPNPPSAPNPIEGLAPSAGRPALNLVRGLPDERMVRCKDVVKRAFSWHGTASFPTQIKSVQPFHSVWVGPAGPKTVTFRRAPIVNDMADPDVCGLALRTALTYTGELRFPWFNHPARVLGSGRETVAERLADVPGLVVPKTIRIKPAFRRDILAAVSDGMLRYPVLVRIAGNHGGLDIVRLDGPDAIEAMDGIPWGGRELYVTQFVDYRNGDGYYRKQRFAVVGGRPILRHSLIGTSWLLHAERRLRDERSQQEEGRLLAEAEERIEPQVAARVAAIYERLGLDYFGIDCSLQDDGAIVIFEVNATMNILANSRPSPNIWDRPIARITNALLALLQEPKHWVDALRTRDAADVSAGAKINVSQPPV